MWKRINCNESLEKSLKNFVKVLMQDSINRQAYASSKRSENLIT